jgi:hypothetical protein
MEKTNSQEKVSLSSNKTFIAKKLLSIKNLNKFIVLVIIFLSVFYVAGVNDLSIKGFALSDLKQQKNKLVEANNKLELEAMTLSSYSRISERVSGLKMVAVGEVSYLSAGGGIVAKK